MSVRTMSLVFEYDMPELKTDDGKTVPDSTAKFVLLALSDHCNDDGESAYIGVKRICKKTSMSSQTVCNALNALRTNGYTTYEGKSKAGTNNYTVNLDKLSQPLGFQPLESDDSSHQSKTIPAARVKPSINHEINHPSGKKKFSNPLWDLQHGKTPEFTEEDNENIKLEQGYKTIAAKLETGLRRGEFPQTPKAQVVYKWILKKEESGQTLERFIQWAMRDEKSASFSWIYHKDIELIKRDWMQAFPAAPANPDEKRSSSFYA
ncbi:MAG: helix-turn-helix domain-containing protein [Chloroflexi bacterium]|nr:MAG: helix-turn-helix domain-containing protein [Chloroflexota bacterium]